MNRFISVLFDLDGTLIDPGEGTVRNIQFLLDQLAVATEFDSAPRLVSNVTVALRTKARFGSFWKGETRSC
jgi:phosphoglycolate phosphatase-like HAD superfamily hydrolase